MPDTPTDGFPTYNHLATTSGFVNLSEGNLKATSAGNYHSPIGNTMYMSSGKWYWEIYVEAVGTLQIHGIVPAVEQNGRTTFTADIYPGSYADEIGYRNSGAIYRANGGTPVATYSTYTTGDILGFALDMDNGTLDIYKNNSSAGAQFTGLSGEYRAVSSPWGTSSKCIINFGQDSSFNVNKIAQGNADGNGKGDFFYSPPSGYLALCNANLPDPAIDPNAGENPEDYFNTVLYTGNGSTQSITGVGFQPDFVWTKARSAAKWHYLLDTVRGQHQNLYSNSTTAEQTYTNSISFDADGFSMGANTDINASGQTQVAWNWKAGGTAVTNDDGSIQSTVSANTDAGFSIVSYTGNGTNGATVGHGLSSAPQMIIAKNRDTAKPWTIYHESVHSSDPADYRLQFDTSGITNDNTVWNDTEPTASVFTLGNTTWHNTSGDDIIAYCFHNVEGYSRFGSFQGNGSSNGSFVYTGFRPAFVIVKKSSASGEWVMWDNKRSGFNVDNDFLYANASNAEFDGATYVRLDLVSNGFKMRDNSADTNGSGATYIYMAFAEQPFKYSNAR